MKGVYPKIPNHYSSDLSAMLSTLLQVDPKKRPTCDELMEHPIFRKRSQKYFPEFEDEGYDDGYAGRSNLLKTIRIPKNFMHLSSRLPKKNYDSSLDNLIYVGSYGDKIPTLLQNTSNTLNISHNIFFDSSRIDLDSDLLNNAIFADPHLVNVLSQGINDPLLYKIQNNSIAIGNGKLISGSNDSTNYLNNNGGKDYFGNIVSNSTPPNIGAFNGEENQSSYNTLKKQSLFAYPSVTIDKIQLKSNSNKDPFETYIFDVNGKLIDKQFGETISLINFQKGIYLLKVKFGDEVGELRVVKL